ncbi:MAG: electron transfer flavoprotein subunit beta/FixA family protein [Acetobacteraceae bacterium]
MHIVVVLRLVPDLTEEIDIADGGTDIDREWIGLKLNEFDDQALEEAVILKEREGARVTALALEDEGVDRMLQAAIARGADRAVKIARGSERAFSARAATPVVAAAVSELGADLVLTGVQTPEDLFGQLAPFLGAALGWPHASAVTGILLGDKSIEIGQEQGSGFSATLRVILPAVLGIQAASQPPRYVSGTRLRQAMSEKIETLAVKSDPAPSLAVLSGLALPEQSAGAAMLEGDAEVVAGKLHRLLVERGLVKV